jgi:hypothetical protein
LKKPTRNESLADRYSWTEIFVPAGINPVSSYIEKSKDGTSEVEITTWESEDSGTRFITYSDYPFTNDESEGLFGTPISKWEIIRRIHFRGNTKLAQQFLEAGGHFTHNVLDEIAELRRDVLLTEYGHLSLRERYYFDPHLKAAIDDQVQRLEAQSEGNRRYLESKFANEGQTPPGINLNDFLAQEDDIEDWRVDGIISTNSTSTVVGARKVGKTTFTYNMLNAYLHGVPLLGAFKTNAVTRRIGYVNMELTDNQAKKWFRRSPIGSTDKVTVWNLRGKPNPFRSDASMKVFAAECKASDIEVIFLDPFSGIFTGGGKDSQNNEEVKEFLLKLEAFKLEAGISEVVILVHAGWNTSRSRGASSLEDHPDTIMKIEEDKKGQRWFSAIGRDVDIEEGLLVFNKETGVLTYSLGGKKYSGVDVARERILKAVAKKPGLNSTELSQTVGGSKADVATARRQLIEEGLIEVVSGKRGALSFFPAKGATSPMVAEEFSAWSGDVDAPAIKSGADTDDTDLTQIGYLLPKCKVHDYSTITIFDMHITVCSECFDVSLAEPAGGK